jgi:hypothetical protein
MIAVTPSGSLTSNVQTSLQALDSGKAPISHTHPSSAISDSTAAGRALLTAADATDRTTFSAPPPLVFSPATSRRRPFWCCQAAGIGATGSNKNRVTDAALFNAITIQQAGVVTSGSAVVTGLSDTTNGGNTPISPGMPVSGTGIPANTVVQSVDSSTQVTLSANATVSSTTALVFAPYGVGDGSTSFGIPNRAYVGVGRDDMADFFTHNAPDFGEEDTLLGPPATSIADRLWRAPLALSIQAKNTWQDPVHTLIPWMRALATVGQRSRGTSPITCVATLACRPSRARKRLTIASPANTSGQTTCALTTRYPATSRAKTGKTRPARPAGRLAWTDAKAGAKTTAAHIGFLSRRLDKRAGEHQKCARWVSR